MNKPYTDKCPECKGEITFSWQAEQVERWICRTCNIAIAQSREDGIISVKPRLMIYTHKHEPLQG